jgi:CRP-like cAMP-binding protein
MSAPGYTLRERKSRKKIMESVQSDLRANALLALLEPATRQAISPALEWMQLPLRATQYEEGGPMSHAWFPVEGVLSVLAATSAAQARIEIATIGREGALCVPLLLGAQRSPNLVFAQVTGAAWRMTAASFLDAVRARADFSRCMHRYAYAYMVQMGQGSACNRAHTAEQRCARWLLQTHDRVHGNGFDLTQEFLAEMVGERRATVNQAASALAQRGLIRYSRGHIEVTDRAGLEQAACGCYHFIHDEYRHVLQNTVPAAAP